jgi:hypothetical protein
MSDRLVQGDDNAGEKIAASCKLIYNPRGNRVIHREVDGRIVGGVLYTDWTRESVTMHVAGYERKWFTRFFLWVCFDYPFNQLGCARAFTQAPETSLLSLGIAARLGFSPIAYVPGVYRGNVAKVIAKLERDDCRWLSLGERYSEEEPQDGW